MPTAGEKLKEALQRNASIFGIELNDQMRSRLAAYYEILLKWNDRLHLIAPCSPAEFAVRHVLESLLLLPYLRSGARLVDVGSGAGLPAIPCLIARSDVKALLIEASKRKAIFLREALRHLNIQEQADVIASRFEEMNAVPADVVTSRALDRFAETLPKLVPWAPRQSTLALFGNERLRAQLKQQWPQVKAQRIPKSDRRLLIIIER